MKHRTFFAVFVLLGFFQASGQPVKNDLIRYRVGRIYHSDYANWLRIEQDSLLAKNKVISVRKTSYNYNSLNFKKSREYSMQSWYDSLGRTTQLAQYNHKGEQKALQIFFIDSTGKLLKINLSLRDNTKYVVNYSYDSSGQLLTYAFYKGRKIKLETFNRYEYEHGKLMNKWIYKEDSVKYKYVYRYSYENDTGKVILVVLEDAKGKTRFSWDYDCNHLGVASKREGRTEMKICKTNQQLPAGHRQEVWVEQIKGENYRYLAEFDSLGRILTYITYGGKYGDKLLERQLYNYSGDTVNYLWESYYGTKGHKNYKHEETYLADGRMLSKMNYFYSRKGKLRNIWENQYEFEGDLLKRVHGMNPKHPKTESIIEYEYSTASGSR